MKNIYMVPLFGAVCVIGTLAYSADQIPISAPMTTSIAGKNGTLAYSSVVRIICPNENSMGTGFFHRSGNVITAAHVVSSCDNSAFILMSTGKRVNIIRTVKDDLRDLALIYLLEKPNYTPLPISINSTFSIGDHVSTWGYPSGYGGAAPLLSVGYLAGVDRLFKDGILGPEQWVVNAAFNSGNSGGPVLRVEDGAVIGVVSSKMAPLPPYIEGAIKALEEAKYGLMFEKRAAGKNPESVSEAQVTAEILKYLRSQTQLVIGYAVKLEDLQKFLKDNSIDP